MKIGMTGNIVNVTRWYKFVAALDHDLVLVVQLNLIVIYIELISR